MLARALSDETRANLEDLREPTHRCVAALEQVYDPPERDHWPGKHCEIHAEGDERSDGNGAFDCQSSADSEHDDRAQAAEECEQRIERSPQSHERHVEREILFVDLAKPRYLGSLLAVGANDARAGEILLR